MLVGPAAGPWRPRSCGEARPAARCDAVREHRRR